MRDWLGAEDSRSWDDAVLSVCRTKCMLHSVYAILGVNSWSWHREIVSDNLTSLFQLMLQLKTRLRKQTVYWGNHHEKLGLKRILCECQCTFPDLAGMTPDTGCNHTDTRSSQPNQASCTPDFSYPFVSSSSFSHSSPISLCLVHNSTIIAEPKVTSSLSISRSHDHELTVSTAYAKDSIHRVQHTPSTAYTEYSILRVQHTPSTAYTKYNVHQVHHTPNKAYCDYSIRPRLFLCLSCKWLQVDPGM